MDIEKVLKRHWRFLKPPMFYTAGNPEKKSMINYTCAATDEDLHGILQLQKQNLPSALTADEIRNQGFVTVLHSFDDLQKMNSIEKHVVAKENNRVIAYLLAMTANSQFDIPVLVPMFESFNDVAFNGKMVSAFRYIVVGQVCVDKAYRGRGVLDECYAFYQKTFAPKYDFAITEIDATNLRSLKAHRRIGFAEAARFTAPNGVEWVIVIWDWNGLSSGTHSM